MKWIDDTLPTWGITVMNLNFSLLPLKPWYLGVTDE